MNARSLVLATAALMALCAPASAIDAPIDASSRATQSAVQAARAQADGAQQRKMLPRATAPMKTRKVKPR